jgi:hypothetical protein
VVKHPLAKLATGDLRVLKGRGLKERLASASDGLAISVFSVDLENKELKNY